MLKDMHLPFYIRTEHITGETVKQECVFLDALFCMKLLFGKTNTTIYPDIFEQRFIDNEHKGGSWWYICNDSLTIVPHGGTIMT